MAQYQIWVLDDNYNKKALIIHYQRLQYKLALNGPGWAKLDLHPNDPVVSDASLMRRLLIIREGSVIFGGIITREQWDIPERAPDKEKWIIYAQDYTAYAAWRLVVPASGSAYDERTGYADDVAKAYVYYHAGAGAASARQFSDLTVQTNASGGTSITERARYINLLVLLQKLANIGGFDWRFVPGATGVEFQTKAPYWGYDRTRGNGVNDEAVFSLDRRNFRNAKYIGDVTQHYNYIYVAGQGEGANRTVEERSNATYVTNYKRRELLADARHLTLVSSLDAYGDGVLMTKAPSFIVTALPLTSTWRASTGTTWDIGDKVTMDISKWGRSVTMDAQITAITVSVTSEHLEQITPEMEKV